MNTKPLFTPEQLAIIQRVAAEQQKADQAVRRAA